VSVPLVALRGVGKRFENGTVALRDLSVEIVQGSFTSLLGPSGCGKSTALRLIAGLAAPSAGSVTISNAITLSFVFQEPALMPWRTVAANVMLPLTLQGVPKSMAVPRVEAALAQVGLDGFMRAYPRQLSGGMKMRVSIARALVTGPSLLLMDEPFAALDEITRAKLNDDLLRLHAAAGLTIVFVTHSVYESVFLSDRILVMAPRPGRIVADIAIEAPAMRNEAFRTGEGYNRQARVVSQALRQAMGEAYAN
jgi:NitT/TauT family transport system ATP-binding protein